jgi:hypothetical protein
VESKRQLRQDGAITLERALMKVLLVSIAVTVLVACGAATSLVNQSPTATPVGAYNIAN